MGIHRLYVYTFVSCRVGSNKSHIRYYLPPHVLYYEFFEHPQKYHSGCGEGYDCLYIKLSVQMVSPQVLFELFQKSTHVLFLTKEQSESSFLYSLNPLLFKREMIACHPVLSKMVMVVHGPKPKDPISTMQPCWSSFFVCPLKQDIKIFFNNKNYYSRYSEHVNYK